MMARDFRGIPRLPEPVSAVLEPLFHSNADSYQLGAGLGDQVDQPVHGLAPAIKSSTIKTRSCGVIQSLATRSVTLRRYV